jgi:hypothetical protein
MGSCLSLTSPTSRHPCTTRDCGCVGWSGDNYSEVGAPQRCACGHGRPAHGLADATVDDSDTVAATRTAVGLPDTPQRQ